MVNLVKTIVCLANSRKESGRCIAGRVWNDEGKPGEWIRPVSDRPKEEVSEYERSYEDGSTAQVYDIIDIPLIRAKPQGWQSENWLLDPEYYWEKHDRIDWSDLHKLTDPVDHLWINGPKTIYGINDKIEPSASGQLGDSLRLIKLKGMDIAVFVPYQDYGKTKRRVQARFTYNNATYQLWITDPIYERRYLMKENGEYQIGECFATISIGEFDRSYYKLVAAIFEPTLEEEN